MIRNSIFLRVFLGFSAIIVTSALLAAAISRQAVERQHTDLAVKRLRTLANAVRPALGHALAGGDSSSARIELQRISAATGVRMLLVDPGGRVVWESGDSGRSAGEPSRHPDVARILGGGRSSYPQGIVSAGRDSIALAVSLAGTGEESGVLRVITSAGDLPEAVGAVNNLIVLFAMGMVGLGVVLTIALVRGVVQPVAELGAAARRVGGGELGVKVLTPSEGTIKDLVDSFNAMTESIEVSQRALAGQIDELNGIVSSIQDGLIVLDREGRIVLHNESFSRIAGTDDLREKFYWEVIRAPHFVDLVKSSLEEKTNLVREVPFSERTFLCSAAYIQAREGTVVLIHDITDIKGVERLKKDFVANLSHELRTPLTAIKGFLETVEEEVPEAARRYLGIVRRHTDRLAHIVDDLLQLSELEDARLRLQTEEVDLGKLIEDILKIFEPRLAKKDLRLDFTVEGERALIKGDRFKLEQVFVNLIANAVKYTETGGISIRIAPGPEETVFEIRDTGIGIPEEHLPRIFERFYVVDKSRSKKVGGTGLGLSIVKHIVLLHEGRLDVDSTPGRGTLFRIVLPTGSE
jgi:two-component system phosphate regulon sensor histidine kinase PhoR